MSEDSDLQAVKLAERALDSLFDKYVAAQPADQWVLKPAISKASEELLTARLSLFKEGVLIKPGDFDQLQAIKNEIEDAADTQAVIMGAIRLAAFLGRFA